MNTPKGKRYAKSDQRTGCRPDQKRQSAVPVPVDVPDCAGEEAQTALLDRRPGRRNDALQNPEEDQHGRD